MKRALWVVVICGCGGQGSPKAVAPDVQQPQRTQPAPTVQTFAEDREVWCFSDERKALWGGCSISYEDCERAKGAYGARDYAADVKRFQERGMSLSEAKAQAILVNPLGGCVEADSAACYEVLAVVRGRSTLMCKPSMSQCGHEADLFHGDADFKVTRSCFVWRKR